MTTSDIADAARELRRALDHTSVADWLNAICRYHDALFGEAVTLHTANASSDIDEAKERLQEARPDDVFVGIDDISRAIDEFELRLQSRHGDSPSMWLRGTLSAPW